MSSIKDITMDVDVEPLESQAYRRSREAAQQEVSHSSIAPHSETSSPAPDDDDLHTLHDSNSNLSKGKAPAKRRKSDRISSPSSHSPALKSDDPHGRGNLVGDMMDFSLEYQTARSSRASSSGGAQQTQTPPEAASDIPVKYTPVTKRISRAKKGLPVHTCGICSPAKNFTRAEHLRRHQLSHKPPEYACTVEHCGAIFHRPDLLARHMLKHETGSIQGSSPGDGRSNTAPSPKVETPPGFGERRVSSAGMTTPQEHEGIKSPMSMSSPNPITNPQPVGFSPKTKGNKRDANEAGLPSGPRAGFDEPPTGYNRVTGSLQPIYNIYARPAGSPFPPDYPTATEHLTNLTIPEEPYLLNLPSTGDSSSFDSSASSPYSDGSGHGRYWGDPSGPATSIADWSTTSWLPHGPSTIPQDLGSSPLEQFMEPFEASYTSPLMSSPISQGQHLGVPSRYANGVPIMESVGPPALPTYRKPISQAFPASPSRTFEPQLVSTPASGLKERFAAVNDGIPTISTSQAQEETYTNSYWQNFHPYFPIIHRQTSEPIKDSLLTSAIAAIGTQYHNTPEARVIGSELNESCRRSIDHRPTWTLQTMQAILLTEVFSRFRGRKTTVRMSRHFEELYGRLLKGISQSYESFEKQDVSDQWLHWAETESRKRLLSACFIFDVQQALYHQQARSKALGGEPRPFLPPLCPDALWDANTTIEWQALHAEYPPDQPLRLLEHAMNSQRTSPGSSSFTQSLLICFLATRLPIRENPNYPNPFLPQAPDANLANFMDLFPTSPLAQTCLALHHTPLHDLLTISGDTWMFNQKVSPPSAFHGAQSRLKTWSSSLAAAQAVHHACRILSLGLSSSDGHGIDRHENGIVCLSDYWSFYVAALICWAFGHRYHPPGTGTGKLTRSNSSTATSETDSDGQSHRSSIIGTQFKATTYVNAMLELSAEDLLTNQAHMKGETSAVIDAVRHRLEFEGLGGKCGMLVDCIGVLNKLSNSRKGKWF